MLVRVRVRGIVLLSILVLTLLATFFIGALIQMNPSRLRRTVHSERHDLASAAAKAGVEYALTRLSQDPDWRGDGNRVTVDSPGLVIREDQGNVWGWVRPDDGDWAGFRLRFNYQDGEDGPDGLPQPSQMMGYPGISVNNLKGASELLLPIGEGPDFAYQGQTSYPVPEYSLALLVQGFVGPGVSPDKLTDFEKSANAELVVRELEGLYKVSRLTDSLSDGAVLQAGADSEFILGAEDDHGGGHLRLMAQGQIARMRSKGKSTIRQGAGKAADFNFYPDLDAEVRVGQTFESKAKSGQGFHQSSELPSDVMLKVEWEKVNNSSQTNRMRIPSGVYAVSEAGSGDRVKYYPMTFKEYRAGLISGAKLTSAPLPAEFKESLSEENVVVGGVSQKRDVLTLTRDVEVFNTPGAGGDLAIVPASGVRQAAIPTELDTAALEALPPDQQEQAGKALLDLLMTKAGNPSVLELQTNGSSYSIDTASGLTGGSPADFARDLFRSGGQLSAPGATLTFSPSTGVKATIGGGYKLSGQSLLGELKGAGLQLPPALAESGDSFDIPQSVMPDSTVAQDIEVRFAPQAGKSAAIRANGSILLGSHLSGRGGAVVANDRVDLIGLGIDIESWKGEKDGISVYSKGPINISTYDPSRKKYWDASIKGVMFSGDRIRVRMGEEGVTDGGAWGRFDFHGAAIALGDAPGAAVPGDLPVNGNGLPEISSVSWGTGEDGGLRTQSLTSGPRGYILMIANGVRMMYEPKYLAPYAEAGQLKLSFRPISVVER